MKHAIDESDYLPLRKLIETAGKDPSAAQLFIEAGVASIVCPDDCDAIITGALADRTALDVAVVDVEKKALISALTAKYEAKIKAGFTSGLPAGGQATFQIRSEDQTNWHTAKLLCQDAIAAGNGAVADAHLRCGANVTHSMTFDEANVILSNMASYGASLMQHKWALSDAIDAATTIAELSLIDIAAGWPVN